MNDIVHDLDHAADIQNAKEIAQLTAVHFTEMVSNGVPPQFAISLTAQFQGYILAQEAAKGLTPHGDREDG